MFSGGIQEQLAKMEADYRIGPVHLSLYLAIIRQLNENNPFNPISFFSRELMAVAKISGRATYHKVVKDLHEFGYIRYEPSLSRMSRSVFFVLDGVATKCASFGR
jgi:hypothetical protein